MNHPCPRFESELSAFIDGETSPALRAEIESHVRVCEACRAGVVQLRGVSRALRRWDAQETRYATSAGFRNRVLAGVGAEVAPPRLIATWRIAAAVGLVAAGAGGFALVAPPPLVEENSEVARLAEKVERLDKLLAAVRTAAPSRADEVKSAPRLERVDPLGPVVDAPAPEDASSAPPTPPDTWEHRGERRYLREALPDHVDYVRERSALRLEELLKAQEGRGTAQPNRPTTAPAALSALARFLGEVRVAQGAFEPFRQVQVWPIELTGGRVSNAPRVMACGKAIQDEILRVSESPVRETVVAENRDLKRSVLVLAGDVLVGGVQDRVAREDALIGPGDHLSIQTYTCGRPRGTTTYKSFTSSKGVAPADLRWLVAAERALLSSGLGQDRFDDAVAETLKDLASSSRDGSLGNLFNNDQLSKQSDKYLAGLEKRLDGPNVVGLAVSAGSRLLGVEMFGDHATFLEHRSRLVRSYVLAALAASPDGTRLDGVPPTREHVMGVVSSAPRAAFHDEPPTASGTISVFRSVGNDAFGLGLLDGTRVVHALLFPTPPSVDGPTARGGRLGAGTNSPGDAPASGESGPPGGPARGGGSEGGANPK